MAYTNEEWAVLIKAKIKEIEALTPTVSVITPFKDDLARTIDHTLLKPDATPSQIDELCDQAIRYNFKVSFSYHARV